MSGSYVAVAGALAVLVKSVLSYAEYRAERKSGHSRSEIILRRAGGAGKLLKKSNFVHLLGCVSIFGPLIVFAFPPRQFTHNALIVIFLEIFLLPAGLLLIWDSKKGREIAEGNKQDLD